MRKKEYRSRTTKIGSRLGGRIDPHVLLQAMSIRQLFICHKDKYGEHIIQVYQL
jgi:hypothetical protein